MTPQTPDTFDEELFVKFVGDGKVYAYFQFTTLWNKSHSSDGFDHSSLFPRSLGEIIQTYDVQELHVSLTEGQWRHRYWGYPIVDAASGAELWSWFRSDRDVDRKWRALTAALSGLLCASFNFVDDTKTVTPKFSFRADGLNDESDGNFNKRLRYATLPREIVCTENLTPWKKLLPCDRAQGLSTLLNARHIHNTNYHSVGIHYRQVCANRACDRVQIELKQTVSLVYDLVMLEGSADEWSLRKLFGIALFDICPLARSSLLLVGTSDDDEGASVELSKDPTNVCVNHQGGYQGRYAIYDLNKLELRTSAFNLHVRNNKSKTSGRTTRAYRNARRPLMHANRYIREYGKEVGGVITTIYNNHRQAINVTYFENVPWFVPVYYHTLKVKRKDSNGAEIIPFAKHYTPGKIRTRPYHLEVVFELPARSVVDVSFDFDYMFLKWQEYPPDANHGFYVGSAVISANLPYARDFVGGGFGRRRTHSSISDDCWNITTNADGTTIEAYLAVDRELVVQMRTETFVLGLPTPDFSMPYNVICLSCTVVALAFGPIHNITTKRLRLAKRLSKGKLRTFLSEKYAHICNLLPMLRATSTSVPEAISE